MSSSLFFRGRRLSCGIVAIAPTRELLLCHVTGQRHWDLPKGVLDAGETPLAAALRELREEAGLTLPAGSLRDLGYTKVRNLGGFKDWADKGLPTEKA